MNFIVEGVELRLKGVLHSSEDGWRTREKKGCVSRNYITTKEFASVVLYKHMSVSCLCCLGELVILGYVMTYEDIQSLWINDISQHKRKLNWYFHRIVCLTYTFLQMLYRALGLLLCSKQIIFLNHQFSYGCRKRCNSWFQWENKEWN